MKKMKKITRQWDYCNERELTGPRRLGLKPREGSSTRSGKKMETPCTMKYGNIFNLYHVKCNRFNTIVDGK